MTHISLSKTSFFIFTLIFFIMYAANTLVCSQTYRGKVYDSSRLLRLMKRHRTLCLTYRHSHENALTDKSFFALLENTYSLLKVEKKKPSYLLPSHEEYSANTTEKKYCVLSYHCQAST